ncbi:hypothetical protein CIK05_09280 [Bdellovibrio sp. qaytius]|nr:hypothetical protein CIK05_09280 [Bdellovibrio sp. qaytius]
MKNFICITVLAVFLQSCAAKEVMTDNTNNIAPFKYAGRYMIKIPVTLNKLDKTFFIFDTGIGVNILSKKLCDQYGCKITSHHSGKRMSGQQLEIPMSTLSSLTFAGKEMKDIPVAIWEMNGFLPNYDDCKDIEGFLSLGFFRDKAFTMDYKKGEFILETPEGLNARAKSGHVIPITINEDGPAITIFMPLTLPDGTKIKVEIDLGGDILTLNEKYMDLLKVDRKAKNVRAEKQNDETGHPYVRYYTDIAGPIAPTAAPMLKQSNLSLMFQKIIYDGLIANDYMKHFTVTYDLANSRIILNN